MLVTKRIVALEGDVVRTLPPWKDKTVRVPKGHAWVEGDEPIRSRDSNTFGPVSNAALRPSRAYNADLKRLYPPQLALGLIDGKVEAILCVLLLSLY